ncbi:hypothetical protein TWF696_004384 [Orbilia brochopaga]|uniref:HNH nuclease domain-containing protein n=1 Tax=Orbilia brochopaga TaxID=3140254 RepID=A0AAV9V5Y4_9PEZI
MPAKSYFEAANEFYILKTEAYAPPRSDIDSERSRARAAVSIVVFSDRHGVIWKSPFVEIARDYLTSLKNYRTVNRLVTAAVRTLRIQDIDQVTRTFIEVLHLTSKDLTDASGESKPPETLWQIAPGPQQAEPWQDVQRRVRRLPQQRLDTDVVDRYYAIINSALEASALSLTSELAAVIYLALSRTDINPDPLSAVGINIAEYEGASVEQLAKLGTQLNRIGIDTQHGVTNWLQRITYSDQSTDEEDPDGEKFSLYQDMASVYSYPASRMRRLALKTKERDRYRCKVSGRRPPGSQVCHILAYSIGRTPDASHKPDFWTLSKMLFGEQATLKIRDYLITVPHHPDATSINRLENMITLSKDVYITWIAGLFYFEPLEPDNSTPISVDLSHFAETPIPSRYAVRLRQLPTPITALSQPSAGITRLSPSDVIMYTADTDPSLHQSMIYNSWEERKIVDGSILIFDTNDPEDIPLPHPHLLWFHGMLSRVVRLAGRGSDGPETDSEMEDELTLDEFY